MDFLDDILKQTTIEERDGRKVVIKIYRKETGIVKWFIIKSLSLPLQLYPFTFMARERMRREIDFFQSRPGGVLTPEIYDVNWSELYIVREYVEGEWFNYKDKAEVYRDVAKTIARIHESGYALGDSKFTNFLRSSKGIYVVDAEQSIPSRDKNHMAWDLLVLLITLYHIVITNKPFIIPKEFLNKMKEFLKTYIEEYDLEPVEKVIKNVKLRTVIHVLLPPLQGYWFVKVFKDLQKK